MILPDLFLKEGLFFLSLGVKKDWIISLSDFYISCYVEIVMMNLPTKMFKH